ncbi:glycine cleavage system aminomethyltransferase GcvT [Paenibacillus illinoisensis]|uniref:glycine cleavage system aminomethyltransferase GcvT n=1 Tax=Paenibacillus illinoisensis TaxID=59845 RepID=UPI001C8D5510|nr:glycine cleavage system aminomethyltransferase GcvT [Paenibacillus illinoisensis]MBY0217192.1 glycine cleavage system aminomethyltransferase GcvT [Paenibacillus illinoisensis]MCM3206324.1 glycine cleavage system aminomethyltransferase GcvT [Paenibacillus illinoisensis]
MSDLLRTPLYPLYQQYEGVRCIDFGGWELPVQFSGIQKEHEAVRERAGLFDVSHMGEFTVQGEQAEAFLQKLTTNDVTTLVPGQAQYTLMCYPDGGVVDDLLVYKLEDQHYMLVVNASNIDKDWAWLQEHMVPGVSMTNDSAETALLALQGPIAADIIGKVTDTDVSVIEPFRFVLNAEVCGVKLLLSRTGYTGEDGFELYVQADQAAAVWNGLMEAGADHGLVPAGLGARDTLRFEAKLPLYGQELSPTISPLEAGVGMFVKLNAGPFIGHEALLQQKNDGPARKLVGIEVLERGIPRPHYPIYAEGVQIGEVTTGTQSPTLKRNLGLALINSQYAALGTPLEIEIRGKKLKAEVVKTPFHKRTRTSKTPTQGAEQA